MRHLVQCTLCPFCFLVSHLYVRVVYLPRQLCGTYYIVDYWSVSTVKYGIQGHSLLFFFAQKFDEVVLKDPASHTAQTKKGRKKKTKRLNICSNCKAYRRNVLNNVFGYDLPLTLNPKRKNLFISARIKIILANFIVADRFFLSFALSRRCCFKYITHTHTHKRAGVSRIRSSCSHLLKHCNE